MEKEEIIKCRRCGKEKIKEKFDNNLCDDCFEKEQKEMELEKEKRRFMQQRIGRILRGL